MELLLVLFSPDRAFQALRGRGWAWVLPAVLIILFEVLVIYLILHRFGAMAIVGRQLAQTGRDVPPEALSRAAGIVATTMYVSPLVSTPLMLLAVAAVLLGIVKVFSGDATYPMMLNAAAYAMFAYSLASTVLFLVMFYTAPDLNSLALENPIPLNVGYFVDAARVGKGWSALLSGVNLLNFYLIWLLSFGAACLASRIRAGTVLWPLGSIYVAYVLVKTGAAALF
ncbi:MAG: YIP1 family protein [Bryobacterales bacterium]|nr:YIP1 family protein [Bryobacterales bacterium]